MVWLVTFLFAAMIEQCDQTQLCEVKSLIQLAYMVYSPSLREVRTGTQAGA